eukprot:262829-Prorocentrum_minimum.AAC.6
MRRQGEQFSPQSHCKTYTHTWEDVSTVSAKVTTVRRPQSGEAVMQYGDSSRHSSASKQQTNKSSQCVPKEKASSLKTN